MFARVTRLAGLPPERMDATLEKFQHEHLPALEQLEGFKGVEVMVDRGGGRALAITYWETQDALRRSDKLAAAARAAAVSRLDPDRDPIIDRYEVLVHRVTEPVA